MTKKLKTTRRNKTKKINQQEVASKGKHESSLLTVGWAFMIVSTVILGLAIIPLAWCVPMTVIAKHKMDNGEEMGVGFKVCTLIFVNIVSGILFLCD